MREIVFEEEAKSDVLDIISWYDGIRAELTARFLHDLDKAVLSTVENPSRFPYVTSLTRRVLLKRFPYLVLFRDTPDSIFVLGVLHTSINPARFRRRSL